MLPALCSDYKSKTKIDMIKKLVKRILSNYLTSKIINNIICHYTLRIKYCTLEMFARQIKKNNHSNSFNIVVDLYKF